MWIQNEDGHDLYKYSLYSGSGTSKDAGGGTIYGAQENDPNVIYNTGNVDLTNVTGDASIICCSNAAEIKNVKICNNYAHDITEVPYTWVISRNYDIPCFIKMGCQGNKLSDVEIINNKFENISNVNLYLAVIKNVHIEGNTFRNFNKDAIRLDGGYNYGTFNIINNLFVNDELGGKNGLYFRSIGNDANSYETDLQVINIRKNSFINIGTNDDYTGAISSSAYQEYGAKISVLENEFKNCPNYILLRNNATAENLNNYKWTCTCNLNVFYGVPNGYYYKCRSGADTSVTNPDMCNFDDNLFFDNEGAVITDRAQLMAKFFGVKDFASYLESYEDIEAAKKPNIIVDGSLMEKEPGEVVTMFGKEYIVGENAFSILMFALEKAQSGDIIYIAKGTIDEEIDINKAISIYGANYNVNPNTSARDEETILSGKIYVNSDGVTINGVKLSSDSQIIASQEGIKDLVVSNVIVDENYTLNDASKGVIEL